MQYKLENSWQEILKNIELLKFDFKNIINLKNKNIALYGAGRYGKVALKYLKKQGYNIVCFIDNSPQKQGTEIDEIPVVSINHFIIKSVDFVFITIKGFEFKSEVAIKNMSFDAWYIVKNIDKYEHIRNNIFCDDSSKQTLDGVLLSILTNDKKYYSLIMDFNQYFCLPYFRNNSNEYFVDVGSYIGDSIEKFIWANDGIFKQIIAFEPGVKQYNASKKRILRLVEEWALNSETISVINAGVADKEGSAHVDLSQTELPSLNLMVDKTNDETSSIKITTLDKQLENVPVTFIKADIEGMEMAMLRGAKETILKNKPKLAICVYHNINDLIEVIGFLQAIVPNYKMALRHHSHLHSETVLYCWIE